MFQMNDGVFIVRMIGIPDRYFVEKRFLCDESMIKHARKEIEMIRRCRHQALSTYVAGFITDSSPFAGSVYVEFCDKGSLEDVIKAYKKHQAKVPEGIIWHAFLGLFDGLAYLQGGGRSMTARPNPPNPNWRPLLHRDIKPDNVLLRGRTTYKSQKPPYFVLSDFGLTCEEGTSELSLYKCGTSAWWAPELLYTPYPRGNPKDQGQDWECFKVPQGRRADVWALGTTIYAMAKADVYAHITLAKKPAIMSQGNFFHGTASRRLEPFNIDLKEYTKPLQDAILICTEYFAKERPDAIEFISTLKKKFDEAERVQPRMVQLAKLADWAAPSHNYRADESEVRTGVNKASLKASMQSS